MTSVLHVYKTYFPDPPGGLQEAIKQIALACMDQGYAPRVFALSPSPVPQEIESDGIPVCRSRSWLAPASCDLGGPGSVSAFRKAANAADIIHYHFPWPFADVLNFFAPASTPKVMTYHSDIVRQRALNTVYTPLMRRTLSTMDSIVTTSPSYAKDSPALSATRLANRLRHIPLGIEESTYPAQHDDSILSIAQLQPGDPFFLFIGVLRYYKGLHFLIEAAKQVDLPIVIAGAGPEEAALKATARQLGLNRVIFVGRVTDAQKMSLLKHCTAFVLPSHLRSEAFGMVLVEASMHGKPMVTCEMGTGTSYVNLDSETGYVVPPTSPHALARAMNLLASNPDLVAQFGREARRRYDLLFSGAALGQAYATLYQDVLGRPR